MVRLPLDITSGIRRDHRLAHRLAHIAKRHPAALVDALDEVQRQSEAPTQRLLRSR